MSVEATHRNGAAARDGLATARMLARPGIAVAASAPIALVALSYIPAYRPPDMAACVLSVVATAILVLAAELACFAPGDRPARPDGREANLDSWSDPAMVSVGRWLAHWPGVAGVSAASWWAARVGGAGLLCQLAFTGAGAPFSGSRAAAVTTCAAVIALAMFCMTQRSRHLTHVALGVVAVAGLVVTGSGLVALQRGQLTTSLLPSGPVLSAGRSAGGSVVQSANTVVLLCVAAVCLVAVTPATSVGAGRRARRAIWLAVGAALTCWVFAVPALLRAAGFDFYTTLASGSGGSIRSALAVALAPLAGPHAAALAGWVLWAACLAAALGALNGGTAIAVESLSAVSVARAKRHVPSSTPGATQKPGAQRADVRSGVRPGAAALSGLVAGGVALSRHRAWLLIAIGCLAAAALALTTLAPPVLRQCQRVPGLVRVVVAAIWVVVETLALGASGPLPLLRSGWLDSGAPSPWAGRA